MTAELTGATGSTGTGGRADIAVTGLSCRFPGAPRPARFWENLRSGTSSVGTAPDGRWPVPAGRPAHGVGARVRSGGFIDGVMEFDAGFFGIARREAEHMDPQQRLLLELAWEALEDAAVPAAEREQARWGVFVGACADDFRLRYFASGRLDRFGHMGTSRGMLAGRLSHHLGLRGPSEVVDTGQSSSLAAVHRAVAAIRLGECEAALVGGVNLNLLQDVTDQVQLWGGLSPDGLCHTFDEAANGYVRGEGGGCVVLKPLAAAVRDGDHVYCVVRGSATNNDGGRAGLGVPSPDAQREVVEAAHAAAGVAAADVAYVELHGTGTPVGDPVEAHAIGAAVGRARPDGDPVRVGSVKTNIGHLESAAGIAGLIKACLVLHHGWLPPSLHHVRSPAGIPLAELNIRFLTEGEERRFAPRDAVGVSSFGMGGTNVHVVLGPAPSAPAVEPPPDDTDDTVWCLSGRTREAVRELARSLLDHPLPAGEFSVADVAWTLSHRGQGEHRAAVVGGDLTELRAGLEKVAAGQGLAVPESWTKEPGPGREHLVALAAEYAYAGGLTKIRERLRRAGVRKVPLLPPYPFERQTYEREADTVLAGGALLADGAVPMTAPVPAPSPAPAAPVPPSPAEPAGTAPPPFVRRWNSAAAEADRLWLTRSMLEDELLAVQGGSAPDLDPDRTFLDLGVDSMTLLELLDRITAVTTLELPDTALFDHPTINELAALVNGEMETRRG